MMLTPEDTGAETPIANVAAASAQMRNAVEELVSAVKALEDLRDRGVAVPDVSKEVQMLQPILLHLYQLQKCHAAQERK